MVGLGVLISVVRLGRKAFELDVIEQAPNCLNRICSINQPTASRLVVTFSPSKLNVSPKTRFPVLGRRSNAGCLMSFP